MTTKPAATRPSGSERAIEVILFDVGNVLLPYDRRRRVERLLALGADPSEIDALFASGLPEALDCGRAGVDGLAEALSALCRRPVGAAEAVDIWTCVFWRDDRLWALLDQLDPRLRLGVFSDNPAFVGALLPPALQPQLVFFSSDLGLTKPAPAAFSAVQQRLGGDPASVLFVDDVQENVAAARRHGWRALQFTSAEALRAEFAALRLLR